MGIDDRFEVPVEPAATRYTVTCLGPVACPLEISLSIFDPPSHREWFLEACSKKLLKTYAR
ncbi:MAG: hypothetical protein CL927_01130 [Deltaproteobacteria bacterium]|nr:hypothetical protein [Deltaproteobacteria bacterium]